MGAVDPINALFNYGYSLLESQCWRAINANGLDPYIGFVHEMASGKAPLVYDLQEPFRWLVDMAIIRSLDRKVFQKKDFVLTENYNIRLRPDAMKKLIGEINSQFTSKVSIKGRMWEWGYVISCKAGELADFLGGRRSTMDLGTPAPDLARLDSAEVREKILHTSYAEWKKMGFSKGTLHNLKTNAKRDHPFTIYGKVKEKLEVI